MLQYEIETQKQVERADQIPMCLLCSFDPFLRL